MAGEHETSARGNPEVFETTGRLCRRNTPEVVTRGIIIMAFITQKARLFS